MKLFKYKRKSPTVNTAGQLHTHMRTENSDLRQVAQQF